MAKDAHMCMNLVILLAEGTSEDELTMPELAGTV